MHLDIDWVRMGLVTSVKNQGTCQAGWAFAAIASVETAFISKGMVLNLSEQQLVDCSGPQGNQGCNGGLHSNGLIYVKNNGITTE